MLFLYFKILIAILLSLVPFLLAYFSYINRRKSLRKNNAANELNQGTTQIKRNAVPSASSGFFKRYFWNLHPQRFHEGMRHYESFRKFLHLMLAFTIAFIQLIDLQATSQLSKYVISNHLHGADAISFFQLYGDLVTLPLVTVTLFIFDLFLFWYKPTDRLLNLLHSNRFYSFCFGVLAMVFIFYSPRCLNLSEAMLLVLMAAYFYPPIADDYTPKARKPILNIFQPSQKAA